MAAGIDIDSLLKEWEKHAKAGNMEQAKTLAQLLKPILRSGASGPGAGHRAKLSEQAQQGQIVRQNKILAAELRKMNKAFPNIAAMLSGGGGGSVTGHLGAMQGIAGKSLFGKAKKYSNESRSNDQFEAELKQKDKDKSWIDPDERKSKYQSLKKLRKTEGSGTRMGKMMKKADKFMEGGAGKGLAAGGMMGVSILTMAIKKAMEASPMMQAMLKIMNTAMMLFLRPIGDFIGGMVKPIFLFFLREIAIPTLKAGKGMMKMGEQFGKQILGFLLKPMETIQAAIVNALGVVPFFSEALDPTGYFERYSGTADWASDKRQQALIDTINAKLPVGMKPITLQDVIAYHDQKRDDKNMEGMEGQDKPHPRDYNPGSFSGMVYAEENFGASFDELMTIQAQQQTATYEIINEKMGMYGNVVADTTVKLSAMDLFLEQAATAAQGIAPEFENAGEMIKFLATAIQRGFMPAWMQNLIEWEDAGKISPTELKNAMDWMIKNGIVTPFDALVSSTEEMAEKTEKTRVSVFATTDNIERTGLDINAGLGAVQKGIGDGIIGFLGLGDMIKSAMDSLAKKLKVPSSSGSGGKYNTQYGNMSLTQMGAAAAAAAGNSGRRYASGGIINEQIWGVGKSGQTYQFGERGSELITPMDKAGGSVVANINVNIDKVSHDVDLEKIKPIVERALLEVHSRRGII